MDEKLSFEKAMEKLEKIVKRLESGDLKLEDALKAYEDGVLLSQHCNKILEEAEEKITMIKKESDSYREVEFPEEL